MPVGSLFIKRFFFHYFLSAGNDEKIDYKVFNYDLFKCDYAFTIDGGIEGSINYENFNAASALVTMNGINIHPGSAKNHMINSIELAYEFYNLLPKFDKPQFTENYEGFNHLTHIVGTTSETSMHFIIRNHDKKIFNEKILCKTQDIIIRNFIIFNFKRNKISFNIF